MNNPFARMPLDEYRRRIAASHGDSKIFNVELGKDEMAVVLQIHDYGIDGITAEDKQLLYAVIAELKHRIHP